MIAAAHYAIGSEVYGLGAPLRCGVPSVDRTRIIKGIAAEVAFPQSTMGNGQWVVGAAARTNPTVHLLAENSIS
jgi:hypothetical protein